MEHGTNRISAVSAWVTIAGGTAALFTCTIREALGFGHNARCAILAMVGGTLAVVMTTAWYFATKRRH